MLNEETDLIFHEEYRFSDKKVLRKFYISRKINTFWILNMEMGEFDEGSIVKSSSIAEIYYSDEVIIVTVN